MNKDLEQAAKHLGKKSSYTKTYDKNLLVAVDRRTNRESIGYKYRTEHQLPFIGYDIWNAYEVSFLNKNGFPISGVAKIIYSSQNKTIVESKSLKLYLNSFNGTKFEDISSVESVISTDLTKLLKTKVEVKIYTEVEKTKEYFEDYIRLEKIPFLKNIVCSQYSEDRSLLGIKFISPTLLVRKYSSNVLRSNCKITHQPDWGDAFIYIKGHRIPDEETLLRYLVSFRDENHFHEEVCEAIYYSLWNVFQPEELMVCCRYTRRGGISIAPIRASNEKLLNKDFINVNKFYAKGLRE